VVRLDLLLASLTPAVLDAEVADLGYTLRCYLGLNQATFWD